MYSSRSLTILKRRSGTSSVVGCNPGYPKDNDPHQLLQVRSTSLWDLDGSVSSSLEDSSSVSKPGGSLFSVSSSSSACMFNIGLMGNWSKGQGQWARSMGRINPQMIQCKRDSWWSTSVCSCLTGNSVTLYIFCALYVAQDPEP